MEIAVNADFSSLPTGLQIGIAALTVLEFVLLLLAVVVNLKTPESRLTLPASRGWRFRFSSVSSGPLLSSWQAVAGSSRP